MVRPSALLASAADRLRAAGVASPEADARTLLAWAMGVETWQLATEMADEADAARFDGLVDARAAGRPLQYLTGVAYFRTISLAVGPGVFIPRPETETMVGWAIDRLAGWAKPGAPVVVELCAGSGAISLAIAAERPGCHQFAVESADAAFAWLVRNCGEAGPVQLVHADMADALSELDGTVDLVIANPPYVPERDRHLVADDVLAHEPAGALFAGPDGLDAVAVVAQVAARLLRRGGLLACEHDDSQGASAPALVAADGSFDQVEDHVDLVGRPRYVTARRR